MADKWIPSSVRYFFPELSPLAVIVGVSIFVAAFCLFALSLRKRQQPSPRIWASNEVLKLLQRCPSVLRGPQPPVWAQGGHFQLMLWLARFVLQKHLCTQIPFKRYKVSLPTHFPKNSKDGGGEAPPNNDHVTLPSEVCSVDIFPGPEALPASTPCVILLSGLRGHSRDLPGTTQAQAVIDHGWRCIVFNRRGHTPGEKLTAPRFNIFGDTDDALLMLEFVRGLPGIVSADTPLFLVGNSTGSALCFNIIQRLGKDSPFLCALGICAGYDISLEEHSCSKRSDLLYEKVFIAAAKKFFCQRNRAVLEAFSPEAYSACIKAQTFHDFLVAHAPFAGYQSAEDFVKAENPMRDFPNLLQSALSNTPIVLLNSEDDPVCGPQNVLDHAPLIKDSSAPIGAVLSRTGSHCPFLDGPMLGCWSDTAMLELFDASLDARD